MFVESERDKGKGIDPSYAQREKKTPDASSAFCPQHHAYRRHFINVQIATTKIITSRSIVLLIEKFVNGATVLSQCFF